MQPNHSHDLSAGAWGHAWWCLRCCCWWQWCRCHPLGLPLGHGCGFVGGVQSLAFAAHLAVPFASGDTDGASDVMPLVRGVRLMPIDRVRSGVVCRFRLTLIFSKMGGRVRYETYETVTLLRCCGGTIGLGCRIVHRIIFFKMGGWVRYETYETGVLLSFRGFRRFCSVGGWPIFIFFAFKRSRYRPMINLQSMQDESHTVLRVCHLWRWSE